MIAPEPNDRIVGESILFKLIENLLNLDFNSGEVVVVVGPIATDGGRIGIVGRQNRFGRVVPLFRFEARDQILGLPRWSANLALMSGHEIEDREERLIRRPFPPMSLR